MPLAVESLSCATQRPDIVRNPMEIHMPTQVQLRSQPTPPAVRSPSAGLQWTRPAFEDLRFGFEITMYISAR